MSRRTFTIRSAVSLALSALSLALCLMTAAGFLPPRLQHWTANGFVGCDLEWRTVRVYRLNEGPTAVPPYYTTASFLGFEYGDRVFPRGVPTPGRGPSSGSGLRSPASVQFKWIGFPCWFFCPVTAILPVVWLWRYRRDRRARSDGMPHCATCDYNLTGNVSGICPECGTTIPADLVRKPIQ